MESTPNAKASSSDMPLEVLQESDQLMAGQGKGPKPGTGPRQDVGH